MTDRFERKEAVENTSYTRDDDKRWWTTYIALVEKQLIRTIAEEANA